LVANQLNHYVMLGLKPRYTVFRKKHQLLFSCITLRTRT